MANSIDKYLAKSINYNSIRILVHNIPLKKYETLGNTNREMSYCYIIDVHDFNV